MIHLLDTNVFRCLGRAPADLVRREERTIADWFAATGADTLRISVLTLVETRRGIELLRKRPDKTDAADAIDRRLTALLADYGAAFVIPVDTAVAREWGTLAAERDGDRMDLGIAATARAKGFVLVTRNTKDFRGRGVALLNPAVKPWTVLSGAPVPP